MTPTDSNESLFDRRHALMLRIWHLLFLTLMLSTIVVVTFATQVYDTRANAPTVMEEALARDVVLNEKQARGISHYFEEKLWVLHTYIGYGIAFLLLCRVGIEVAMSKQERWINRLKEALRLAPATDQARKDKRHFIATRWIYLIFYSLVLFMACTGIGLALEDIPFFDSIHRPLKEVHEIGQYAMYTFVVIHIIGVLRADFGQHKGIISGMIGGKR